MSPITQSVCSDNRCNPNGLILLSNQLADKNACTGTYVQCSTYLKFPPDIQNHVIKSFLVDQACGVNVIDDGKNAPNYPGLPDPSNPDSPTNPSVPNNPTDIGFSKIFYNFFKIKKQVPEGSNNLGFVLIILGTCIGIILLFVAIYYIVIVSIRKRKPVNTNKK